MSPPITLGVKGCLERPVETQSPGTHGDWPDYRQINDAAVFLSFVDEEFFRLAGALQFTRETLADNNGMPE